jgi:SAM-dependent methyltransferase
MLRCVECGGPVRVIDVSERPGYPELGPDGVMQCADCGETYPLIAGTPRMLTRAGRARLAGDYPDAGIALPAITAAGSAEDAIKRRTADSFAYEWEQFGGWRDAWQRNFLEYMQPHDAGFFAERLVLDVGTGSGRHSLQAARLGARVVAVDLGRSIDVARRNLPPDALTVQADAERLPFDPQSFDFVMSIGVLHHLPDTERALRAIVPFARSGGRVHVYLYWIPERAGHRAVLRLVTAARRLTVRLPHRLLHALCYPLSAVLFILVVLPHRALRRRPRGRRLSDAMPLKTYADYPFGVLVNDQFDRFSAPLEHRYRRDEVETMLRRSGLEDVQVLANAGWVGDGVAAASARE